MSGLNIMVVDDSGITGKKLSKMLEGLGHTVVHIAKTGQDAVDAYGSVNPDLVTMDITMPDMDGIEATRLIMAAHDNPLVVMVTSHGQEQMVMDAIDAGAKGYVLKPVKVEKLQESIEKAIANR
ncbi:MAG: response regulator [Planctomycetes bacterium]|nr:response regulator [Planctomycetota bacterium]